MKTRWKMTPLRRTALEENAWIMRLRGAETVWMCPHMLAQDQDLLRQLIERTVRRIKAAQRERRAK